MVFYRVNSDFEDIPVDTVVEYFSNLEKRHKWDHTAYESIEEVKKYPMDTVINYVKCRS